MAFNGKKSSTPWYKRIKLKQIKERSMKTNRKLFSVTLQRVEDAEAQSMIDEVERKRVVGKAWKTIQTPMELLETAVAHSTERNESFLPPPPLITRSQSVANPESQRYEGPGDKVLSMIPKPSKIGSHLRQISAPIPSTRHTRASRFSINLPIVSNSLWKSNEEGLLNITNVMDFIAHVHPPSKTPLEKELVEKHLRRICGASEHDVRESWTKSEVEKLLWDPVFNSIVDATLCEEEVDRSRPLSEYYISTSHNSYLLGGQYSVTGGKVTVEACLQALRDGCRCLELDCYDGSHGEPIVTHFNQRIAGGLILFHDAIKAISSECFRNSNFPLILNLENHVRSQLNRLCEILQQYFGARLLCADDPAFGHASVAARGSKLPTLDQLMGRVICRTKVRLPLAPRQHSLHEGLADLTDVTYARWSTGESQKSEDTRPSAGAGTPGASHYLLLRAKSSATGKSSNQRESQPPRHATSTAEVVRQSQKQQHSLVPLPYHFTRLVYLRNVSWNDAKAPGFVIEPWHTTSVSEKKVSKLLSNKQQPPHELLRENQSRLMRVFPKSTAVASQNYNPVLAWSTGFSLVALNYQTNDLNFSANQALFRRNGACGFVLKPASLRQGPSALVTARPVKPSARLTTRRWSDVSIAHRRDVAKADLLPERKRSLSPSFQSVFPRRRRSRAASDPVRTPELGSGRAETGHVPLEPARKFVLQFQVDRLQKASIGGSLGMKTLSTLEHAHLPVLTSPVIRITFSGSSRIVTSTKRGRVQKNGETSYKWGEILTVEVDDLSLSQLQFDLFDESSNMNALGYASSTCQVNKKLKGEQCLLMMVPMGQHIVGKLYITVTLYSKGYVDGPALVQSQNEESKLAPTPLGEGPVKEANGSVSTQNAFPLPGVDDASWQKESLNFLPILDLSFDMMELVIVGGRLAVDCIGAELEHQGRYNRRTATEHSTRRPKNLSLSCCNRATPTEGIWFDPYVTVKVLDDHPQKRKFKTLKADSCIADLDGFAIRKGVPYEKYWMTPFILPVVNPSFHYLQFFLKVRRRLKLKSESFCSNHIRQGYRCIPLFNDQRKHVYTILCHINCTSQLGRTAS